MTACWPSAATGAVRRRITQVPPVGKLCLRGQNEPLEAPLAAVRAGRHQATSPGCVALPAGGGVDLALTARSCGLQSP